MRSRRHCHTPTKVPSSATRNPCNQSKKIAGTETHSFNSFVSNGKSEDDGEALSRLDVCFLFWIDNREHPVVARALGTWDEYLGRIDVRAAVVASQPDVSMSLCAYIRVSKYPDGEWS